MTSNFDAITEKYGYKIVLSVLVGVGGSFLT